MSTYQAESLDDIARHFTEMAGRAATRAGRSTGVEKKLLDREAVVWGQAAAMLRQTKLAPSTLTPERE